MFFACKVDALISPQLERPLPSVFAAGMETLGRRLRVVKRPSTGANTKVPLGFRLVQV
jgi:hypothetical protein